MDEGTEQDREDLRIAFKAISVLEETPKERLSQVALTNLEILCNAEMRQKLLPGTLNASLSQVASYYLNAARWDEIQAAVKHVWNEVRAVQQNMKSCRHNGFDFYDILKKYKDDDSGNNEKMDAQDQVVKVFTDLYPYCGKNGCMLKRQKFWLNLLGSKNWKELKSNPIRMVEIHKRLRIVEDHIMRDPSVGVGDVDLGNLWREVETDGLRKEILEISSKFPEHLLKKVEEMRSQNVHLDEAANGRSNQWFNFKFQANPDRSNFKEKPVVEGFDLEEDGERLGTVVKIENVFSPEFALELMQGISLERFMSDPRRTNKDRAVRFAASGQKEGDIPRWLQVGSEGGGCIFNSLPSCKVEDKLLNVMNFIVGMHSAFVNDTLDKTRSDRKYTVKHALTQDHDFFDSLVTVIANQETANWGLHDDGKHGTCLIGDVDDREALDDDVKRMTKFNIIVPTLVVQNHGIECTSVEFFSNTTGEKLKSIKGGPFWMHLQLVGVQQNTKHKVSWICCECCATS